METTTVATTGTAYDHQQQVVKNKRKKFNPKYMLSNSSSDDEVGNGLNNQNQQRRNDDEEEEVERSGSEEDEDQVNNRNNSLIVSPKLNDIIDKNSIYQIPNTNFSISKSQNNNNDSPPPPPAVSSPVATSPLVPSNPFLSPSKLSLLQTFGNLQHQQQLLQQAAVAAAIAPQYNQQNPAMSLTETEAKFREFAFKTMQELLNIYGLSLSPNDIVDAMKQQHLGQTAATVSGQASLEPPTPPRTPVATAQGQGQQHNTPKHYNNNNDDAKENYEENSMRQSSSMSPIKVPHSVKSKLVKSENESDLEEYPRRSSQYDDSNYSDDERLGGGRHSVISGSGGHMNGADEESDHGSDLYTDASSFDSSKLSLKNVENLLDKSSPMSFYNPMMHLATIQNDQAEKQLIAEYSKYLTKYQSYLDCHNEQCQMENQREHYHCYDIMCQNKILNKKEEIIRHLKWHKKRSESLNHGFLRFTSSDDCTIQFGYCQHNRKQTHYHCIQNKCDKTYISTSDVQMHSNYHRKDSAIYQEGFQRYRATEKCMVQHCIFYGQCTTHFHCRRCKYTFKNKADMEKHKTYHMKDEQLLKDGFKKFLKTEACKVDGCRFTMICNHIHCVRSNCTYVLHSSGQLLSHKRKHERMDAEMAYRRFKMGQSAKDLSPAELSALQQFHGLDLSSKPATPTPSTVNGQFPIADQATNEKINKLLNNATMENLNMLLSHETNPADLSPELLQQIQLHQEQQMMKQANGRESPEERMIDDHKNGTDNGDSLEDGIPKSVIQNHPAQSAANDEMKAPTIEEVEQIISQYFTDQCTKQHSNEQNEPLNLNLKTNSNKSNLIECFMSNNESHLHCLITGCEAVVPRGLKDISEHLRMHELNRGADSIIQNSNLLQITSIEGFFNRKRGRPPKNRVVEVYNNTHQPPQAIFTSFKLERNDQNGKNSSSQSSRVATPQNRTPKQRPEKPEPSNGTKIQIIQSGERCCDSSCVYQKLLHYHCNFSKFCHFSTNQLTVMDHHLTDFHTTIEIQENYDYFDRNFDCKMRSCCYNKITSHFHCLLCKFIFTSPAEMSEHVCEENIEDNYENFDIIESDLMKARPQPSIAHHQHQQRFMEAEFFRREEKPMALDKFDEKFYSHESKVALNSDVDLIKTTKVPYVKPELMLEDDKVSVVRAAGTWVPHNSDIENKSGSTSPANSMMNSSFPGMGNRDDSNCDRPFCKLKRKKHEHCDLCNQAFTDSMKLKIHFLKHQHTKLGGGGGGFESDKQDDMSPVKKEDHSEPHDLSKPTAASLQSLMFPIPSQAAGPSSSSMMDSLSLQNMQLANLAQFYQQNSMYYQSLYPFLGNQGLPGLGLDQQMPMMQFPFPAAAAALAGGGFDFGIPAPLLPGNKSSMASHKRKLEQLEELQGNKKIQKTSERPKEYQKKSYKDDSVPTGYLKFRFNQDCNFPNCGYRNHQSHFHCCRKDCFYSFCDKTRFVQHTARHERLDKLMGDDFKQFRANMHCGYSNCAYNKNLGPHNKSSHFHCLKCNYICSDTNKVVAHRRQHSKQEYIRMAGFRKISNNEHCNMPDANTPDGECPYTLKQTHYHCLVCKMSVLSRNQLPSHNHRIRPGNGMGDEGEMMNDNGILILGDNGSDDGSST